MLQTQWKENMSIIRRLEIKLHQTTPMIDLKEAWKDPLSVLHIQT